MIKQNYKQSEWEEREDFYADELSKLVIPDNVTVADIKVLSAKINRLYDEAVLDLALVKRKFDSYEKMKKLTEKQLFFTIKQTADTINVKMTEKMVEGAVFTALGYLIPNKVLDGSAIPDFESNLLYLIQGQQANITPITTNLFTVMRVLEERLIYMQSIVEMLKDKHSTLITLEGALKLEVSLSNQAM